MERVGVISLLVVCSIFLLSFLDGVYANLEGDALYAFKMNMHDPGKYLESWDSTLVNPCTWFHVTCNNHDIVIRIDLGNAGLFGHLGSNLTQLTKLESLKLNNNSLIGYISNDFGNLESLEDLDLSTNGFVGEIPESLGLLPNLKNLQLNDNTLEGNFPLGLTNISSLIILDLSSNNLNDTLPEWRGYQQNLTIIQLSNNKLSGSVPESWDAIISRIREVDLTTNTGLTGSCTANPCKNY